MRGKFSLLRRQGLVRQRFNEARALCAGSLSSVGLSFVAFERFNEARALCAGSYTIAAMTTADLKGFNEARALCAGSSGLIDELDALG